VTLFRQPGLFGSRLLSRQIAHLLGGAAYFRINPEGVRTFLPGRSQGDHLLNLGIFYNNKKCDFCQGCETKKDDDIDVV